MASSYTGLGTELMTTGENAGTWGSTTNTNLQILEQISGGYTAQSIAGSAQTTTLSVSDGSTGATLAHRVIEFTGTITGNQVVTIPLDVQQLYVIKNNTSGAYTVQLKYATGTGSSVTWGTSDKGTKLIYATADDGTNPNLVDSNIGGVGAYDLNGAELTLDADADTSITASTDDQIDFEIAGADDFTMTANAFNVLSGSHVTFADSANAKFGTGNDMLMYHDGSNSYITNAVGALKIATETSGIAVTIGHTTSEVTVADNLTVTGTLTGTLATAAQGTVTSLGTLTTLTVDNVITNGATIGHTSDTDLMTLADGVLTVAGELDATTLDISGNADIDGTTNLDAVDIDGAVQLDATLTVGADDQGYDIKFFGDTASAYMLWDTSADDLVLAGAAGIDLAGDIDVDGTANLDNTDIDGTLAVDGTTISLDATTSLNIDNSNTSNGITIGTATSGVPISIGHGTSETTVNDNLTVTGDLTVNGTTTTVNSTTVTIDDPIFTLGGDSAPGSDDNKDRGIEFRYHDGSNARIGFFGYDDSATGFTFLTAATNSSEVFSGTAAKIIAGELDISGNMDIDGTSNLDAVDIDGAVQIDSTVTVGVDDTGHDVKFFGATSGAYMLWDESTDDLVLAGAAKLYLYDAGGGEYISSSGSALTLSSGGTAWELPAADGSNGQLLKTDGSGNLDWTTVSGTITALNNQAANRLTTIGSTTTELDGEANLSFTGSALTCIGTVTVGVDDTGHDVKFFGATSGAYMLWDESSDDLVLAGAAKLYLYDAAGGEHISSDGTDLTLAAGADLNLTATTDINVPANVGVTFGNDGEKIEGDGTDLTIAGNNINLTATADVVIPANVGITFGTGEKIEGDSTDLTVTSGADINLTATADVNVPANVGVTFGNDGEKIEGDGTDLTIAGNNINLTATADVVIPANVGITFGSGEKIEGDSTDLTVTSGAKINLTATSDVHIPNDVGIVFGGASEKIEGDGTDLTISANNLTIDCAADLILDAGGNDFNFKAGGTEVLRITNSSSDVIIKPIVDAKDIIFQQRDGTEVARIEDNATFNISSAGKFAYAGTAVTSTAAELNIVDGGTSATSTTVADADRVVLNDNGTMVQVAMTDIKDYIGGGTSWQAVKTANFTAAAGQGVFCNTTSSAFTITLPAGTIGDEVSIIDYAGTFDSNNLTVAANGSEKIHGSTDDLTVATERAAFTLVFTDSTQGWLLKDK